MSSHPAGPRRLRPFTVDHFRAWAKLQTLDNGRAWDAEDFQLAIVEDIFDGYGEVLALLPTGNAKTTLCGGCALYVCQFKPDARVPIGAAAKDQAAILYEQAAGFVNRSPSLKKRFKIQDGYRRIVGVNGSLIRVYSSDADTGDGILYDLAFIDELHRHRNDGLYSTWRDKRDKRDGQLVTISTAGDDENNPLEELRLAARKLPNVATGLTSRHTIARSDDKSFVMHEFALRRGDDVNDLDLVKEANPLKQITTAKLKARRDSPSTKPWQWARFTCNLPMKGEQSAIQPQEWDVMRERGLTPDVSSPALLWLDLAWKIDHAAVGALVWESNERRVIADVLTIPPPVNELAVVAALLKGQLKYQDLRGVVIDPNAGGHQMAQQLEMAQHILQTDDNVRAEWGLLPLEGEAAPLEFIAHSQDNAPMSEAAAHFEEALRGKWFVHDHDSCSDPLCRCGGLRGHVLNAVTKPLGGEKFKYDRPSDAKGEKRRKVPIDGLTGVLMANNIGTAELMDSSTEPMFAWM